MNEERAASSTASLEKSFCRERIGVEMVNWTLGGPLTHLTRMIITFVDVRQGGLGTIVKRNSEPGGESWMFLCCFSFADHMKKYWSPNQNPHCHLMSDFSNKMQAKS